MSDAGMDPAVKQTAAERATGVDTDTILQTEGLTKRFGGLTAIDDVDLGVEAGELRCLIGPNGAGKSTMLNLVTGALTPSEGSVYFQGHDITQMDPHERIRRGLSIKFQVPSVYEDLSVRENVRLPVQRLATGDDRDRRIQETLAAAGLADKADVTAGALSHGEQQQLEIGMAAALDPDLLLLDEPVAGMAVDERAAVADRITSMNADLDLAFVVIEHDIDFVARIADHVTVLDQGEIFREGSIEEIRDDPEVRRIYLGGEE
jgi:branched-chain amino acid transport system ATP-binding protein